MDLKRDRIPLMSRTNKEIAKFLQTDVIPALDVDYESDEYFVLREAIKRLERFEWYIRRKQQASYKFEIGDIVEMERHHSPSFGLELEAGWMLMQVMGYYEQEMRVPQYYVFPVARLHKPEPHHWWHVEEEKLRLAVNPQTD